METMAATSAPITIIINPEARISVTLVGALSAPMRCGKAMGVAVKIVNQGFITSRLESQLVNAPVGVSFDFHPTPLKGLPEELRKLRITLMKPGLTDVTISFKTHNEIPDLGGRDHIRFL